MEIGTTRCLAARRVTALTGYAVRTSRPLAALALASALPWVTAGAVAAQDTDDTGSREQTVELAGRIVDATTRQPIHGAFVGLKFEDWGVITDSEGRFRLRVDRMPNYLLAAETLGYETSELEILDSVRGEVVIGLEANPFQLGEIRVMVDRFRTRRNASSMSVRAFERTDLLTSTSVDLLEFLRTRTLQPLRECPFLNAFGRVCVMRRGRVQPVQVYVDEMPVFGGIDELRSYRPQELFMIEVYDSGRHIRLYSAQYMARIGKYGRLNPIPINE